jgi:uncharacterized protein YdhG (YjbR/CyaY superfamily)
MVIWCILLLLKNTSASILAQVGVEKFKDELSVYDGAKGSVQFPLDKPVPFGLISRIVKFRVNENLKKAEAKRKKQ